MKKTSSVLMALLMATIAVQAQGPFRLPPVNPNHTVTYETVLGSGPLAPNTLPVGTSKTAILPPDSRITLQNGIPKILVSLVLDHGTWSVSGGSTIQFNAQPGSGFFYAMGAFSKNQPVLPLKADDGLESNRHDAWWAPADPKPHVVWIIPDSEIVYFMIEGFGQTPADLMEAFGTMSAYKTSLNPGP